MKCSLGCLTGGLSVERRCEGRGPELRSSRQTITLLEHKAGTPCFLRTGLSNLAFRISVLLVDLCQMGNWSQPAGSPCWSNTGTHTFSTRSS